MTEVTIKIPGDIKDIYLVVLPQIGGREQMRKDLLEMRD